MLRGLATCLAALVLAPAASAWTPLVTSGVQNIADPGVLLTQSGTELVVVANPVAGTISLVRAGGSPRVLVSGDPIAGNSRLVQQPSGAIQLYFPNAGGVARLTSTDDGQSWTGPVQTQSHDVGPVVGAAVRPDGTPLFSQDGTGFVNVFQGLNGEVVHNVFPHCCGYAESLAVDSTGLAQIAFWSNASSPFDGYLYAALDADAALPGNYVNLTGAKDTAPRSDRVPLASDALGTTFALVTPGYPSVTELDLLRLRGGAVQSSGVTLMKGGLANGFPHMALAVDAQSRVWALWTNGTTLFAARSRTHGASFGAITRWPLPSGQTVYQLEALASSTGVGSADVFANFATSISAQHVLPGLSARLVRTGTHLYVAALDDGFGVAGATVRAGSRTLHTNGSGKALVDAVRRGTVLRISKAGYVGTSIRVP